MSRVIALFAKEPRTGYVKTRLIRLLGAEGAAQLARAFLADSSALLIRAARQCAAVPMLFFDPPEAGSNIESIVGCDLRTSPQTGRHLGERLANAYRELAARGHTNVCFVGGDSPTLPLSHLVAAFDALDTGADLALGPAMDGGYYAIALNARSPHRQSSGEHDALLGVFEGIAWSTPHVYQQTRSKAAALGLSVVALPAWYDVDDAASLERLCRELDATAECESKQSAAHTRRALENLGFAKRPTGRAATLT